MEIIQCLKRLSVLGASMSWFIHMVYTRIFIVAHNIAFHILMNVYECGISNYVVPVRNTSLTLTILYLLLKGLNSQGRIRPRNYLDSSCTNSYKQILHHSEHSEGANSIFNNALTRRRKIAKVVKHVNFRLRFT